MAAFNRVIGKKIYPLDSCWLRDLAAAHRAVTLDVGTGDGRFVLDGARVEPERLWIGLDPVAKNMDQASRIAGASPKKGGVPNAVFLVGAAEQLPGPLVSIADEITINYPWGSLLKIVSLPDTEGLKDIFACAKEGAALRIYLNYSVFEDTNYLERLGLAAAADIAHGQTILDGYTAAGSTPPNRQLIVGDPPFRSQWARQLVRGSSRTSLVLESQIVRRPMDVQGG